MNIDAANDTGRCKQFKPQPPGSLNCKCGHTLYQHYMCGSPQESRCLVCKDADPAPRTQPSQTELRIPDDLKAMHAYCTLNRHGCDLSNGAFAELIERIARLEGSR